MMVKCALTFGHTNRSFSVPGATPAEGRPAATHQVGRCPACGGVLEVRRLQCPRCETAVEGRFSPSPYAALDPDQAEFLELFLRARGNLREVERVLGLSYPTVRARLDVLLQALGFAGDDPEGPRSGERRRVLAALQRGEITAAEAIAQLGRLPAETGGG